MRGFISIILCAVLAMTITSCAKSRLSEAKGPIKISINQWPGYAYAYVAQEKGFFRKNGVSVELIFRNSTPESLGLFKSGEVEGCFSPMGDVMLINSQGYKSKMVCIVDYSDSGDVIIGRPEFKSLSELKNKTVSFEGVNTFSHFFVIKMLEKSGVGEFDLKFADIKAHDVLRALKKGEIDAGHTWEPTTSEALKEGYKILAKAGDIKGIIIDVIMFDPEVLEKRPHDIKLIIKSLFEALNYVKDNPEESIKIMAQNMKMSEEEMRVGLEGIYQLSLKDNLALAASKQNSVLIDIFKMTQDFYMNRGQITNELKIEEIFDYGLMEDLNKQ